MTEIHVNPSEPQLSPLLPAILWTVCGTVVLTGSIVLMSHSGLPPSEVNYPYLSHYPTVYPVSADSYSP